MAGTSKLLHVLGGGQWQLPTIELARSMGYRVLVTDMYQERPAYALADLHEVVDLTDAEGTLQAARRHGIDGIVCDTTDVGVPTMAYVAEALGLPGIGREAAQRFTDKYLMRKLTAAAGIQSVRHYLVGCLEDLVAGAAAIGYPVVVKPADNQSSRGVHRVDGPAGLAAAWADARRFTRQPTVLVEEFLRGTEITVEGLMMGGQYHTLAISDKDHFPHRPEVANRLTYPGAFDERVLQTIRATNEAVVRTLGLPTGVTHAEYMVDGGRVALVEIAARGAGSFVYSHIAPHVSGIDAPRLYLQFVMGETPAVTDPGSRRAANLEFFSFPAGRVTEIRGVEEARALPGVAKILLEFGVGDELRPPEDDRSRPGLMVVLGDTRAQVLATSAEVKRTVRVEVA
ncbi:MAG: ATP-grasp domain-containing protein [Deltaproteobacteria bacterium]|nr:ATP-grasp domain-containing protein [Deltaproteobacteria bacterium]